MWTDTTRALHARGGLALPSDLTDAEWALLEPFFPPPSHVGRPRKWPMRRIVEAILYLLRGGLPIWLAGLGLVSAAALAALSLPVFGGPALVPVAAAVSLLSLWMVAAGVHCLRPLR